jgi:hypothetical protein
MVSIISENPGYRICKKTPKIGGENFARVNPSSINSIKNAVSYVGGKEKDIDFCIAEFKKLGYAVR